jgi:DNA-binding XRE family transcriptional regulator
MNKVKELREQRGYTVSEFARQLNVDRATVYRIEKGQINPRDSLKKKIAMLLGSTVGHIFFDEVAT